MILDDDYDRSLVTVYVAMCALADVTIREHGGDECHHMILDGGGEYLVRGRNRVVLFMEDYTVCLIDGEVQVHGETGAKKRAIAWADLFREKLNLIPNTPYGEWLSAEISRSLG